LLLRQLLERRARDVSLVTAIDARIDADLGGLVVEATDFILTPRLLATDAVDQPATRDHRDEHTLGAAHRIEARRAAPKIEEDLLGRILGIRRGRGEARDRPDQRAVTNHATLHGRAVATRHFG
jgi:hypothetical protein